MTTYSTPADMMVNNLQTPDQTVAGQYVQRAADEIDSRLGFRYVTPIVIADTPATRASMLLLTRISTWLSTGWYILATSVSQEDDSLNAYGNKLVSGAEAALAQIESGAIVLSGATFLNTGDVGESGPILSNLDAASQVENFYNFVSTPNSGFGGRFGNSIFPTGDGSGSWIGPI